MRLAIILLLCAACAHEQPRTDTRPVAGQRKRAPRLLDVPAGVVHKEARELIARGDWEGAADKLEDFLEREPKNAVAHFESGWVAEHLQQLPAAEGFYKRAVELDPGQAGAAVNLARLWRDKPAAAEPLLRAALARQSDDPRVLDALTAVLIAQEKVDEADALVHKVLERHPKDADAYKNLAAVEAARGHVRLAESALQNARKLDDKDAGILNSLGLLAMKRDDVVAARTYFDEATRLDPRLAAAWANLGSLALQFRDYAAAQDAYARAVELDPGRWPTRLAHAWALEGLRKHREARGEYEKVLALEPGQEDALYGRALSLRAENELPAALQAFKAYLASGKPARSKEAESQIAAIDLRLKNPAPQARTAPSRDKPSQLDLSKLPQGGEAGPPAEKLPEEVDGPGDGLKTAPNPAEQRGDSSQKGGSAKGDAQAVVVQ